MAQAFPSLDRVRNFRDPLEPGEYHLLEHCVRELPDDVEVYVQPMLNGDRPDLVLMRPHHGVLIIEVKDWNLSHYGNPAGGEEDWILLKNDTRLRSPLKQVQTYKRNLYNLHIRELAERRIKNSMAYGLVQTAVYFHNASTEEAEAFCRDSDHVHIFGRDALSDGTLTQILHKAYLMRRSRYFDDEVYSAFHRFLQPPEHLPEDGIDITYTAKQEALIASEAGRRQKVRGVAGSGKTKVLAARAVNAHRRTGRGILALTFNITLRNYIHDRISEVRRPFPWGAFTITNYHQFVKSMMNRYGIPTGAYPDLLQAADHPDLFAGVSDRITKYDTILVDEVQDYKEVWLRTLTDYFLADDGEFVVFGDEKQNVYGRPMGKDRFPVVPTVVGRWNELNTSFRMQSHTLDVAQAFQRHYFGDRYVADTDVEMAQGELFGEGGTVRYIDASGFAHRDLYTHLRGVVRELAAHPNDIAILAPTYDWLRALEFMYRQLAGEETTHATETQEEYNELLKKYQLEGLDDPAREKPQQYKKCIQALEAIRRTRKVYFWANAGTVKLSTIHSFKGWEASTLVLLITDTEGAEGAGALEELLYTALTRVRKNLIVYDLTDGTYGPFFKPLADPEQPPAATA